MTSRYYELTVSQKIWFRENYPNMRDCDLAYELGVCTQTARRWAKRLCYQKSKEYYRLKHIRMIEAARKVNKGKSYANSINALKPYQFKKGENTRTRYGDAVEEKRIRNSTDTRIKLIKKDKARMAFGLPRLTNYNLGRQNPQKLNAKKYLTKLGYRIDKEKSIAYYNDRTKRGKLTEKRNSKYYQFKAE